MRQTTREFTVWGRGLREQLWETGGKEVVQHNHSFIDIRLLVQQLTKRKGVSQWRRQEGGGGKFPPMGGRPKIM